MTEQGGVEADLFRLRRELEFTDLSENMTEYDLEDFKTEGKRAGIDRFKYWKEQVDKGKVITEDSKNRIVLGTMLFDDHYSIVHNNMYGILFKDEAYLIYNQLTHPGYK